MAVKLQMILIILSVTVPVYQSANTELMKTMIENYFSEARHHETNKGYKLKARQFIHDEFERFGLETQYQTFFDNRYPQVTFANIIGILKGERFGRIDDKFLGVAAHYDTMPDTPGVDDNGAGVAAMLEVVRQVTEANKHGAKRKNTIMFISFDAEELHYIGGQSFTKNWIGNYLIDHYGIEIALRLVPHGFIVMDTMMNYNTTKKSQVIPETYRKKDFFPQASTNIAKDDHEGDFLLMTFRKPTTDKGLATSFLNSWNKAGHPEFEIESFPLPLQDVEALNDKEEFSNFMRSDHVALWRDKYPAIFISDSANFRGTMVHCYHKKCDDRQMLTDDNLKFLGKTVDVITATLNTLSEASGIPGSGASGNKTMNSNSRHCTTVFHLILVVAAIAVLG